MQARDQPSALPLGSVVIDLTRLGTMCWRGAALVEYFRKQGNRRLGSGLCSLTFVVPEIHPASFYASFQHMLNHSEEFIILLLFM